MGASASKKQGWVTCPTCDLKLANELELVQHYNQKHNSGGGGNNENQQSRTSASSTPLTSSCDFVEFKRGDRVFALWEVATWQYFPATIVRKVTRTSYEIDWDDGDTTGRLVNIGNLYLDVTPNPANIKVGSLVLFKQGAYRAGDTQETGGFRWHQGRITNIRQTSNGGYSLSGHHTKGPSAGKSTTYRGYSYEFYGLDVGDVRLSSSPSTFNESTDSGASATQPSACIVARTTVDLNQKFYLELNDRVIAEWNGTGRYYSATVLDILPESRYLLNWDDNDAIGRTVTYYCVNLDSIPRSEHLTTDSVVYFNQDKQWHAGTITRVHADTSGRALYDGEPLSKRFVQNFTNFSIDKLCSKIDVNQDGSLDATHVLGMTMASPAPLYNTGSLLSVGDRVLAMWVKTKWQYFPARIVQVLPSLQYKIEWDDGDTTGQVVDCFKIAKDVIPSASSIGVGSIVLFQQGGYSAGSSQLHGGTRWHQGIITNVRVDHVGVTLYDGCHTKGEADGKWITYRSYSYSFVGMKISDLRVGPNMFDIMSHAVTLSPTAPPMTSNPPAYSESGDSLNQPPPAYVNYQSPPISPPNAFNLDTAPPAYTPPSLTDGDSVSRILKDVDPFIQIMEENLRSVANVPMNNVESYNNVLCVGADVFISYCWTNSLLARDAEHIPSFVGSQLADPRRIAREVAKNDLKVWLDVDCLSSRDSLLQQHAEAIKNCRVFIPCISDQYAASVFCRMQFQYACGLPDKTIIPLVVGDGSDWKSSVIGLALERDKEKYRIVDFQLATSESIYTKSIDQILSMVKV